VLVSDLDPAAKLALDRAPPFRLYEGSLDVKAGSPWGVSELRLHHIPTRINSLLAVTLMLGLAEHGSR
jgi:hypothetical protein